MDKLQVLADLCNLVKNENETDQAFMLRVIYYCDLHLSDELWETLPIEIKQYYNQSLMELSTTMRK